MSREFPALDAELRVWRDEGLRLPVWWRDDDAVEPTPALERLMALSAGHGAPLHLAVIPKPATQRLADALQSAPLSRVLPHGWQHRNHAPADQKKAEFGAHRPLTDMLDEIAAGWQRIRNMFGERAVPLFTPPWNRISAEVVASLPGVGLRAVSTFGPRKGQFSAAGVLQVNTHVDPIAWHEGGGLVDTTRLDAQMASDLLQRRSGQSDNSEPYGLLTHHLVQDEATWAFTARVLELFSASDAAAWVSPIELPARIG